MKTINSNLARTLVTGVLGTAALVVVGCSTMQSGNMAMAEKDGDITVPGNYKSWPKFVSTVDKSKSGQVREIYINNVGMTAKKGNPFPYGTMSIMEIYAAKKDSNGNLVKSADGKLVKGDLSKVFVMAKGKGYGAKQAKGVIDNADWLYGAYLADAKTPATKDFTACRACHAPLADKDFIHRYDEHFASK